MTGQEPSGYFRVRAKVTFTAEYFVPVDEYIQTEAHALENVRSGLAFTNPDNILVDHTALLAEPIFPTDDDGNPLTSTVQRVARDWAEVWRPNEVDEFVTAYTQYVTEQKDGTIWFPGDYYALIFSDLKANA
jgi:hypothetical protein